jgi:hypothetical protein
METLKIRLHSFVDIITNSSTELFVIDQNYGLDYVKEIRRFNGIVFCIKHTNFDLSKLLNEVNK